MVLAASAAVPAFGWLGSKCTLGFRGLACARVTAMCLCAEGIEKATWRAKGVQNTLSTPVSPLRSRLGSC